ncbi:MAG: DUF4912 domain-containing protein [Candidatus Omnitrophota bacterium]
MSLLRKIKEVSKKWLQKIKESRLAKKIFLVATKESLAHEKPKKEIPPGTHETTVEKSKFFTPESPRISPKIIQELSSRYGQDRIVLQVRDSWWMHTYWEVTPQTIDSLKSRLADAFYSGKIILRVYDVTSIIFDGKNANSFFDIEINYDAISWYINSKAPGRSWCVDIGLRLASSEFITIARSNMVETPLDGPSWIMDEEWMIPEDMFARLYGMGFGFGRSSPIAKVWAQRFKEAVSSASGGIASMASPVKKIPKQRKFWMTVNTELIVYGATEPDAKVTVQGKPIKLRPDGTFSLRFALCDGKQVIPCQGISADEVETITITPVVGKETKYHSINRELVK